MKMTAKQLVQFIYEVRNKISHAPVEYLHMYNNIDLDYPDGIFLMLKVNEYNPYVIRMIILDDTVNVNFLFYINKCKKDEIEVENKKKEVEENVKRLYYEIINTFD